MIQSCAVSPPNREGETSPATVLDVLLLLLALDKYPILGNHDWAVFALLEKKLLPWPRQSYRRRVIRRNSPRG